jgi:hypothetical protein
MRPEDRDAASLWDALQAAERIVTYVAKERVPELIAQLSAALPAVPPDPEPET